MWAGQATSNLGGTCLSLGCQFRTNADSLCIRHSSGRHPGCGGCVLGSHTGQNRVCPLEELGGARQCCVQGTATIACLPSPALDWRPGTGSSNSHNTPGGGWCHPTHKKVEGGKNEFICTVPSRGEGPRATRLLLSHHPAFSAPRRGSPNTTPAARECGLEQGALAAPTQGSGRKRNRRAPLAFPGLCFFKCAMEMPTAPH